MRQIPLPLSNGFMKRSELELNFLRVNLFCKVRLGLVTCGGGLKRRFLVFSRNIIRFWSLVQVVSRGRACGM